MGVSKNTGTPKWMVKIMENPMNKWMIWGETPLFLETPIYDQPSLKIQAVNSWNTLKIPENWCLEDDSFPFEISGDILVFEGREFYSKIHILIPAWQSWNCHGLPSHRPIGSWRLKILQLLLLIQWACLLPKILFFSPWRILGTNDIFTHMDGWFLW